MPREAERLTDGLLRQLRPVLVAMVDAALSDAEPQLADSGADEAAYVERSASAQLARYRTKSSPTAGQRRTAKR